MIHHNFHMPGYAPADLLPIFRQSDFSFLPRDLEIFPNPGQVHTTVRAAVVEIDEIGCVRLRILGRKFTKDELHDLRERAQRLEEGFQVTVLGKQHCMALFYSRMTFEDHDVACVDLGFELDPFAEKVA